MMTREKRREVYEEGRAAFKEGKEKCPYRKPPSKVSLWKAGYEDARKESES